MKAQENISKSAGAKTPSEHFAIDRPALVRLAQGTAVLIATLLALPDAVALITSSPDPLSWSLRLLAVWISALVLWFLGYLCLMQFVAWLSGGVTLAADGLKLWRFGRLMRWQSVKAVAIEPQILFSRIFSIKPPAYRLTLFTENKPGGRLMPHSVPSFLFSPKQFERLVSSMSRAVFDFSPAGLQVLLANPADLPRLRPVYELLHWLRIAVSLLIAVGLISSLGRKATVNYLYNHANHAFQRGRFIKAGQEFKLATEIDPLFAQAWQNLGGTQWRLGDSAGAVRSWKRALALKPDLVEPKVSLSFVYMHERKFQEAREMLDRALRVAPANVAALTNQADLDMRLGHVRQAMTEARLVLTLAPSHSLAPCLIAQGRLRLGMPADALAFITQQKGHLADQLPFCRLIKGECYLAVGDLDRAEQLLASVVNQQTGNSDALTDLARVKIGKKQWAEALALLNRAHSSQPADPGPLLALADLYLRRAQLPDSFSCLKQAIALPNQDAASLARAARLSLALNLNKQARSLAEKSFRMEPETQEALWVLEKLAAGK